MSNKERDRKSTTKVKLQKRKIASKRKKFTKTEMRLRHKTHAKEKSCQLA